MQGAPIHCIVEGLVDEAAVRRVFVELSLAAGAFYHASVLPRSKRDCGASTKPRAILLGLHCVISTGMNVHPPALSGIFPIQFPECAFGSRFGAWKRGSWPTGRESHGFFELQKPACPSLRKTNETRNPGS